jgi:hypothetical protein
MTEDLGPSEDSTRAFEMEAVKEQNSGQAVELPLVVPSGTNIRRWKALLLEERMFLVTRGRSGSELRSSVTFSHGKQAGGDGASEVRPSRRSREEHALGMLTTTRQSVSPS